MSQKIGETIKLLDLKSEHTGKWIVRSSISGRFVAVGETLADALEKSSLIKGKKSISKIIPQIYAGACL